MSNVRAARRRVNFTLRPPPALVTENMLTGCGRTAPKAMPAWSWLISSVAGMEPVELNSRPQKI